MEISKSIENLLDGMYQKVIENPTQESFDIIYDSLDELHKHGFDIDEYLHVVERLEVVLYGKQTRISP